MSLRNVGPYKAIRCHISEEGILLIIHSSQKPMEFRNKKSPSVHTHARERGLLERLTMAQLHYIFTQRSASCWQRSVIETYPAPNSDESTSANPISLTFVLKSSSRLRLKLPSSGSVQIVWLQLRAYYILCPSHYRFVRQNSTWWRVSAGIE
jgi:hypothetical protein